MTASVVWSSSPVTSIQRMPVNTPDAIKHEGWIVQAKRLRGRNLPP